MFEVKKDIVLLGFWTYSAYYSTQNIKMEIEVKEGLNTLEDCDVTVKRREFVKWGVSKIAPVKLSKPVKISSGSRICLSVRLKQDDEKSYDNSEEGGEEEEGEIYM